MYDAIIDEIAGRRIRVGDHWLSDFASCNYLGFDLEPEIIDAVDAGHPHAGARTPAGRGCWAARGCTREIEEQLTDLLGAPGHPACCRRSPTSTCR